MAGDLAKTLNRWIDLIPGEASQLIATGDGWGREILDDLEERLPSRILSHHDLSETFDCSRQGIEEMAKALDRHRWSHLSLCVIGRYRGLEDSSNSEGWISLRRGDDRWWVHFHIPRGWGPTNSMVGSPTWLEKSQLVSPSKGLNYGGLAVAETVVECLAPSTPSISPDRKNRPYHWDSFEGTKQRPLEFYLSLLARENPLYYHRGRFHPPLSQFPDSLRLYRGSFNPLHNYHLEMGREALFEICIHNSRKGSVDGKNLAHRLAMVDLFDLPILLTAFVPTFVAFQLLLRHQGFGGPVTYITGMDSFNAIVDDRHVPSEEFLEPLHRKRGVSFAVFPRADLTLTNHHRVEQMEVQLIDATANRISSTAIRAGLQDHIPPEVQKYIEEHGLYRDRG